LAAKRKIIDDQAFEVDLQRLAEWYPNRREKNMSGLCVNITQSGPPRRTRSGKHSFELKFDAGRDPATGTRRIQYASFKGTKRQAQIKLAELITAVGAGSYVEPSKSTVAEFVRGRVDQWQAGGVISARTAQRYRQLIENQIAPHVGAKPLQKLARLDVEGWHNVLHQGGLAPRTIGHAQRVLSKALSDAESDGMVVRNVCKLKKAPKVAEREMVIVQDVPGLVAALRGSRLCVPALVALFTGMRLREVLALRWGRDLLDRKVIEVRWRWSRPRQESGSRLPNPRPAAATSPSPISWLRRSGSTAKPRLKCR
jgi:hypothetical protein